MTELLNAIVNNKPLFIIILGSIALIIILLIILLIISNKSSKNNVEKKEEVTSNPEITSGENINVINSTQQENIIPVMENVSNEEISVAPIETEPSFTNEPISEPVISTPVIEPVVEQSLEVAVTPEPVFTPLIEETSIIDQQAEETPIVEESIIEAPIMVEEPVIESIEEANIIPDELNTYEPSVLVEETPIVEQGITESQAPFIEEMVENPIAEALASTIFESEMNPIDNIQDVSEEIIDYELVDEIKPEPNDDYDQTKNDLINELNNQKKEVEKQAAADEFLTTLENYKVK